MALLQKNVADPVLIRACNLGTLLGIGVLAVYEKYQATGKGKIGHSFRMFIP